MSKEVKKKASSYIDTLSSGYESDTVKEYDPAVEEGQIGKEHTEEVAPANNWEGDKRDAIGRAASKRKHLAHKLRRIAREIEAQDMDSGYEEKIDEIQQTAIEEAQGKPVADMTRISPSEEAQDEAAAKEAALKSKVSRDEFIVIEAAHPLEHTKVDDPEANMPASTGDEWINIGPGTFDDPRDAINRAASKK